MPEYQENGINFQNTNKKRAQVQFSAKKFSKKKFKSDQNSNVSLTPKRACRHSQNAYRHFPSADWPECSTWPENIMTETKPIFFNFLEIRMHSNSYLVSFSLFFNHPNLCKQRKKIRIQDFFFYFFAPLTLKTFWRLYFKNFFFFVSKVFQTSKR